MQSDARITDVIHTLDDPEEYVRGVVESCYTYEFNRGRAEVRIGVSGKGIIPNYSIEQRGAPDTTILQGGVAVTTNIELRRCFSGRNHKEILDDGAIGEKWSSASMTCGEVQTLLGHLREENRERH